MKQWSIARRQRRITPKATSQKGQPQGSSVPSGEQTLGSAASEGIATPLLEHDFSQIQVTAIQKPGTPLNLSGSVGNKGQNLPNDVQQVQARLTQLGFEPDAASGRCGSKTQEAIQAFQQFFLKQPDGLIEVNSPSHLRLNQLQSAAAARTPKLTLESNMPSEESERNGVHAPQVHAPQLKVKRGREFVQSIDGKSIDSKLMQLLEEFFKYLIAHHYVGDDITLLEGMRDPRKAHRWSTAYAIRNDQIPLETLKKLSGGRDTDGNQWYEAGETLAQAKRRATDLGLSSPSTPASEGYPKGDSKQVPNHWDDGISNHVIGKAVKVAIPWTTEKQGQLNDPIVNDLIKKFGLKRPVPKEATHFELLQGSPQGDEEHSHKDSER